MYGKEEIRDHKHISRLINGAINEVVKELKKENPKADITNKSFSLAATNNYCIKYNGKSIVFSCNDVVYCFTGSGFPEEDANIEHIKYIVREIIKSKS